MDLDPIALAHESRTAAELEARVLARLAGEIGFDVAFAAMRGSVPTTIGIDRERIAAALQPGSAYEGEMLPVKRAAFAARGVAVDTDVLGAARVTRTRYYRDFVAPVRGRHSLMAYLALRGEPIGALMLGRTGSAFRPQDVERIERMLPALAVARASFSGPGFVSSPLPAARGWSRWVGSRRVAGDREIVVRDRDGFREMLARDRATGREMIWSRASLAEPSRSGWPYVDLFHVAAALAAKRERALFVGCGGAVGPRRFAETYPGIDLDVVESDAAVVELARKHYALDEIPRLAVHVADGVAFVQGAPPSSWDVVVVDAYDASDLAHGTGTRAFFASLHRALRAGGAFAFNVIGTLEEGDVVRELGAIARAIFDDVRIVPVMVPGEGYSPRTRRNVVIVGTRLRLARAAAW